MNHVFGTPGQSPRMTASGLLPAEIALNKRDGEVVLTSTTMSSDRVKISADGKSLVAVPLSLAEAQAERWSAAKLIRKQHEDAGCQTPKGLIQTDQSSRSNINAAAADAIRWKMANAIVQAGSTTITAGSTVWARSWSMLDNTAAILNADDMVAIANSISAYLDAVHQASVIIRAKIFGAKSLADVAAVDITASYPKN